METSSRSVVISYRLHSTLPRTESTPKRSALSSRFHYRIDTIFNQLTGHYAIKRVWTHDLWHPASTLLKKSLRMPSTPYSTIERVTSLCSSRTCSSEKHAYQVTIAAGHLVM